MSQRLCFAIAASTLFFIGCAEEPPAEENPYINQGTGGTGVEPEEEEIESLTLAQALTDFGNCLSIEVFIKTGVYQLYKNATEDNQLCGSCHATGDGAAYISEDTLYMFENNAKFPGVMRLVTGTVDERGNFNKLVPSNRFIDKGADECLEGQQCHPEYVLPAYMQEAIVTFVDESLQRWENGTCRDPYNATEE